MREKHRSAASCRPQPGTWPTTQARTLTGSRTRDVLAHQQLNPLSHTSQGSKRALYPPAIPESLELSFLSTPVGEGGQQEGQQSPSTSCGSSELRMSPALDQMGPTDSLSLQGSRGHKAAFWLICSWPAERCYCYGPNYVPANSTRSTSDRDGA